MATERVLGDAAGEAIATEWEREGLSPVLAHLVRRLRRAERNGSLATESIESVLEGIRRAAAFAGASEDTASPRARLVCAVDAFVADDPPAPAGSAPSVEDRAESTDSSDATEVRELKGTL